MNEEAFHIVFRSRFARLMLIQLIVFIFNSLKNSLRQNFIMNDLLNDFTSCSLLQYMPEFIAPHRIQVSLFSDNSNQLIGLEYLSIKKFHKIFYKHWYHHMLPVFFLLPGDKCSEVYDDVMRRYTKKIHGTSHGFLPNLCQSVCMYIELK